MERSLFLYVTYSNRYLPVKKSQGPVNAHFYTGIFHTDRPLPQQRLSRSLSHLLLSLPTSLFIPFLHAFWTTIITYWPSLPALRLDKYLYLIRLYISHSFLYLAQHSWNDDLVAEYLDLMEDMPLSAGNGQVGDGIRYHVLDVWVDGLVEVDGWWEVSLEKGVMRPVERLAKEGNTRVVRRRAESVMEDKRLKGDVAEGEGAGDDSMEEEDDDFEGFGD